MASEGKPSVFFVDLRQLLFLIFIIKSSIDEMSRSISFFLNDRTRFGRFVV